MKKALLGIVIVASPLFAQSPAAVAPQSSRIVEVKETPDSLKLQLALQTEKSITLQAQVLQNQAMQQIEPQMAPLKADYQKQDAVIAATEEIVRKENGLPPNVSLDRSPQSPTFGKWIKAPELPPPAKAPATPKK